MILFFLIKKNPKNQGQRTAERRGGEALKKAFLFT